MNPDRLLILSQIISLRAILPSPTSTQVKPIPGQVSPIQFIDQSVHSPISWEWDFGDDGTSTEQNPTHSFKTAGTYTISLTVTNDFGSNSQTKTNYISVYQSTEPPVAKFTSDKTRTRENESVSFFRSVNL